MPVLPNPFDSASDNTADAPTIAEAAATGDHLQTLIALRDKLARSLDMSTQARDTASLARNLQLVLKEIDGMPKPEVSVADEFAEKSKARRKSKPKPKASDDE